MALTAAWIVAGAAIWLVRGQQMTADKTIDYLKAHPLHGLTATERQPVIEEMADRVNRLPFEERQFFRYNDELRRWFEQMNETERRYYIDRTLPKGMKQMMAAFNEMTPQKRRQMIARALADLERYRGESEKPEGKRALPDQTVKRVVEEGMRSFFSDASAETKLDLQPFIEQIQSIMQSGR